MRIKKNTKRKSTIDNTHLGRIIKKTIREDFKNFKKPNEVNEPPQQGSKRRIAGISERSDYYKFQKFFIGKLMIVKDQSSIGFNSFVCSFVHDEDRIRVNKAMGYSEKSEYLLEGVKFK